MSDDRWRRHGESRRKHLLKCDEAEGGTSFEINTNCRIQRYFGVAERVLRSFRTMYANRSKMEEIYVMGHRLIAFLSDTLTKHPMYYSNDVQITKLRKRSIKQLDWLGNRLEIISLRIDEEQLNHYILYDLQSTCSDMNISNDDIDNDEILKSTPESIGKEVKDKLVDVSFDTEEIVSESSGESNQWEKFSGWCLDVPDEAIQGIPFYHHEIDVTASIARLSQYSRCYSNGKENISRFSEQVSFEDEDTLSNTEMPLSYPNATDETEINPKQHSEELENSILQTIAQEDVRYETDSEAVDSWAQNSGTGSGIPANDSSGTNTSYDAARIVFEDIMNKVTTKPLKPSLRAEMETTKSVSNVAQLSVDTNNILQQGWVTFSSEARSIVNWPKSWP